MSPYEIVQRLTARCLIRYHIALFRFVLFLFICIHVHRASQLGTIIDRVMRKTNQVDPKRGLLRMEMLMNESAWSSARTSMIVKWTSPNNTNLVLPRQAPVHATPSLCF